MRNFKIAGDKIRHLEGLSVRPDHDKLQIFVITNSRRITRSLVQRITQIHVYQNILDYGFTNLWAYTITELFSSKRQKFGPSVNIKSNPQAVGNNVFPPIREKSRLFRVWMDWHSDETSRMCPKR